MSPNRQRQASGSGGEAGKAAGTEEGAAEIGRIMKLRKWEADMYWRMGSKLKMRNKLAVTFFLTLLLSAFSGSGN